MVLSEGDLAIKLGGENIELCRVVNVHKGIDNTDDVYYDLMYCCEFTNSSDPKSIVFRDRGVRTEVSKNRIRTPEKEFVYAYLRNSRSQVKETDLKYSIRGNII
jgi:hypothetical protein